jgi:hypothetical protein
VISRVNRSWCAPHVATSKVNISKALQTGDIYPVLFQHPTFASLRRRISLQSSTSHQKEVQLRVLLGVYQYLG